jgi:hypothetical protein
MKEISIISFIPTRPVWGPQEPPHKKSFIAREAFLSSQFPPNKRKCSIRARRPRIDHTHDQSRAPHRGGKASPTFRVPARMGRPTESREYDKTGRATGFAPHALSWPPAPLVALAFWFWCPQGGVAECVRGEGGVTWLLDSPMSAPSRPLRTQRPQWLAWGFNAPAAMKLPAGDEHIRPVPRNCQGRGFNAINAASRCRESRRVPCGLRCLDRSARASWRIGSDRAPSGARAGADAIYAPWSASSFVPLSFSRSGMRV